MRSRLPGVLDPARPAARWERGDEPGVLRGAGVRDERLFAVMPPSPTATPPDLREPA